MPNTAVVILNWNGIDFLRKFLGTVVSRSFLPGTEVWVADNGSTDGSAEWISSNHKGVKIIRFNENLGFAGGYNKALENIDADYFILLNSDIEVTEGWLTPLVECLEKNPGVASCQPKVLSFKRKEYFEYAGAAGGFIDKYGYPLCRGRIFGVVEKDEGQYNDAAEIFWSTGACMAVRAEAWRKCGGFDESFFAHMEEIDLCWRFASAGYNIRYVPEAVVYHVGGGSLPYDSPFKTYLNFRNSLYLLYKNLSDRELRRIMFIRMMLDGLAAIMFLFRGHTGSFRAVWKAHLDFYRNLPRLKKSRRMAKNPASIKLYGTILNKSIVFEFYAKGKKTYDALTR